MFAFHFQTNRLQVSQDWPVQQFDLVTGLSTLLGVAGGVASQAASAFLSRLAHHRQRLGLVAQCIHFGPWIVNNELITPTVSWRPIG